MIGLPRIQMSEKMCKRCLVGKQSRNAFNSYLPIRSSTALEARACPL